MSNLLFVGMKFSYKIQILSLDWWRGFDQQDVTRVPKGKVELWFCNEVQGSVKTMVKWCIDTYSKI